MLGRGPGWPRGPGTFPLLCALPRSFPRLQHLLQLVLLPDPFHTVPCARHEDDLAAVPRRRVLEEIVEQMHRVVEEVIVPFADVDVDLALELRRQRRPVLVQHHPQVVLLPVLDNGAVDLAGLAVPQRLGQASGTTRAQRCVPSAPVLARPLPTVPPPPHHPPPPPL